MVQVQFPSLALFPDFDDSEDISPSFVEQYHFSLYSATCEAIKARKQEQHQRDLAVAPERAEARKACEEQEKRHVIREERRTAKFTQQLRRAAFAAGLRTTANMSTAATTPVKKLSEADYEKFAEAAGISVSKFKRKYERGDVELAEDGTPKVLSKKDSKKMRKGEEQESGGKRKRGEDEEKPKKKKKSKTDA